MEQAFFFDSVHTSQNNHWNIFKYKIVQNVALKTPQGSKWPVFIKQ